MIRLAGIFVIFSVVIVLASCSPPKYDSRACLKMLKKEQHWRSPEGGRSAFRPAIYVELRGRNILWMGSKIDIRTLEVILPHTLEMDPVPMIILVPDGAEDCEFVKKIQLIIDQYGDCRGRGICGIGSHEDWKNAPGLKGKNWIE